MRAGRLRESRVKQRPHALDPRPESGGDGGAEMGEGQRSESCQHPNLFPSPPPSRLLGPWPAGLVSTRGQMGMAHSVKRMRNA